MSSRIFIEPLRPLDELLRTATDEDLRATASLSAASRRREALAWRRVVRDNIGADVGIGYDEWGAPVLKNSAWHIGVSHSRNSVAVIVSEADCAIDIESRTRNFERVSSRYLSPQEAALVRQGVPLQISSSRQRRFSARYTHRICRFRLQPHRWYAVRRWRVNHAILHIGK